MDDFDYDQEKSGDLTLYLGNKECRLSVDDVTEWCPKAVLTSDEEGAVWEYLDDDALFECIKLHGE